MRDVLPEGSFALFRDWLILGGAVPAGPVRSQMSRHQKHMLTAQEPLARAGLGVGDRVIRVPGRDEHRMLPGPSSSWCLLSKSLWLSMKCS